MNVTLFQLRMTTTVSSLKNQTDDLQNKISFKMSNYWGVLKAN